MKSLKFFKLLQIYLIKIKKLCFSKFFFKNIFFKIKKLGKELAAIKIQSFWKMYAAVRDFQRLLTLLSKVKIIQKAWRIYLSYKNTKKGIKMNHLNIFNDYV